MSIRERVRDVLSESSETVLYECRNCGTNVDEWAERCHCCGRTGIAQYEF